MLGEWLRHTRDTFQTTSFVTFQCRSCQRGDIGLPPLWNTEETGGPRRARLWNGPPRPGAVAHCWEGVPTGLPCLARRGCGHLPCLRRGAALGPLLVLVEFFRHRVLPRLCRRFRLRQQQLCQGCPRDRRRLSHPCRDIGGGRLPSSRPPPGSSGSLCFLSSLQSGRRAEPAAVHFSTSVALVAGSLLCALPSSPGGCPLGSIAFPARFIAACGFFLTRWNMWPGKCVLWASQSPSSQEWRLLRGISAGSYSILCPRVTYAWGSKTTSETWALMLTLEGGPVSALLFDGGTGRRSEQEGSHTYARATLRGDGFSLVGSTRSRCMACRSLGSDGGAYTSKAGSTSVLHARSRQMSHVTARPGDGGSMILRRRSSETCWSSGSTSGCISPRLSAKECTVLGTWRNPALFRLPSGSAGTESKSL